jgi:hypothetical protein
VAGRGSRAELLAGAAAGVRTVGAVCVFVDRGFGRARRGVPVILSRHSEDPALACLTGRLSRRRGLPTRSDRRTSRSAGRPARTRIAAVHLGMGKRALRCGPTALPGRVRGDSASAWQFPASVARWPEVMLSGQALSPTNPAHMRGPGRSFRVSQGVSVDRTDSLLPVRCPKQREASLFGKRNALVCGQSGERRERRDSNPRSSEMSIGSRCLRPRGWCDESVVIPRLAAWRTSGSQPAAARLPGRRLRGTIDRFEWPPAEPRAAWAP